MNRFFAVLFLLILIPVPGWSETLHVASWNLQNFLLQNRYEHGSYRFNYPKPERQKRGIRELLLQVRPDVLFLQEIGSDAFLLELQKDLAADGLPYEHRHCALVPGNRSGLGVLSRIPLDSVMLHHPIPVQVPVDPPRQMRRGIQEVSFSIHGQHFQFFHLHLKSRYTSDPGDPDSERFRAAEISALAKFLQSWMTRISASSHLFLVGDFNAPFSSPLLDPLRYSWIPVPAADPSGQEWTYSYYRTHTRDRIDGFWCPATGKLPFPLSASVQFQPDPSPSDHRLVLLNISP